MCEEYQPTPRFEDTDKRETARKATQKMNVNEQSQKYILKLRLI